MLTGLAIVQTAGRGALIILRMTGQSVGNEEEGIDTLWKEILGCDERGRKVKDASDATC